jgi:hypothetical protein
MHGHQEVLHLCPWGFRGLACAIYPQPAVMIMTSIEPTLRVIKKLKGSGSGSSAFSLTARVRFNLNSAVITARRRHQLADRLSPCRVHFQRELYLGSKDQSLRRSKADDQI